MAKRGGAGDLLIGLLVLLAIAVWLLVTFWQAAVVVALAAGGLWLLRLSRQPETPVTPSRRRREQPPGTIWPARVQLAALDPTWPSVPRLPEHLRRTTNERNALPFAAAACPGCGVEVTALPKTRKRCRTCGAEMFVRVGADGQRHLMSTAEATLFDRLEGERAAATSDADRRAWYDELRATGVLVPAVEGDGMGLEVVGESHYQADLAGLMAALRTEPEQRNVEVIARLQREPSNKYDRNAIRVEVHGHLVGYLSREDAIDLQAWVSGIESQRRPVFLLATIGGGYVRDDGRLSPIGITLDELPPEAWGLAT